MKNDVKKRKLIDISDRTGKILGMMAVQKNMSFKAYIETLLDDKAKEITKNANLVMWKDEENLKTKKTSAKTK
jgi:hypothetical protein